MCATQRQKQTGDMYRPSYNSETRFQWFTKHADMGDIMGDKGRSEHNLTQV